VMDGECANGAIENGIGKGKGVRTRLCPGNGAGLPPGLSEHDLGNIHGAPCPSHAAEGYGVVASSTCQIEVGT